MKKSSSAKRALGCPKNGCKATYHTVSKPPRVPGICDDCGTPLVQRDDDRAETIRARLVVYHKDTVELIPYYKNQACCTRCPAWAISSRLRQLLKALNQAGSSC